MTTTCKAILFWVSLTTTVADVGRAVAQDSGSGGEGVDILPKGTALGAGAGRLKSMWGVFVDEHVSVEGDLQQRFLQDWLVTSDVAEDMRQEINAEREHRGVHDPLKMDLPFDVVTTVPSDPRNQFNFIIDPLTHAASLRRIVMSAELVGAEGADRIPQTKYVTREEFEQLQRKVELECSALHQAMSDMRDRAAWLLTLLGVIIAVPVYNAAMTIIGSIRKRRSRRQ